MLASRPHPEQGFRTCLGILRSYRGLDPVRVEAVSVRAVELGVLTCKGSPARNFGELGVGSCDGCSVAPMNH